MKTLTLLLTGLLFFCFCCSTPTDPVEPKPTLIQKYTKSLTQTGYWVLDNNPIYFYDFNIDGTGKLTVIIVGGVNWPSELEPIVIPYEWTLIE
ncbi:hypothetical protein LCGC14_1863760, partial [marine sediment metagenome]